ncbi:unnamed protein product [Brachionus calyciflorus]|uniref:Palmitoyltransferase n=1 Tax=Brachionus calyciflorus TaxID=104777 RepID=A0A814FAU3_9BILA|nr:unnamed protein product [Brachionus calyciflorus]
MQLQLPHLPNQIDKRIAYIFGDFFQPAKPFKFVKIKDASRMDIEKSKKEIKKKPVDFSTIFGAVRTDRVNLVQNLVSQKGSNILNEYDADGFTPMHWAVYEGSVEIVKYLFDNNAVYDSSSNTAGQTPMHWACAKGRVEMVSLLVENGANLNSKDSKGFTPLITAAQYGNSSLVTYLISRGADIDAEDVNGDNALHWAVYKAHPDVTRLLILFGINPKLIDKFGQTVLHLACLSGNLNIVQQLIEQDCIDSQIRDKNGRRAIELARTRSYSDLVDYLERHEKKKKNQNLQTNIKTFLFGPVGNSKFVFLSIHFLYWFYEYPVYVSRVLPETWSEHTFLNLIFILNTLLMWFFYYSVHLTEPGYLKQNTIEYHSYLKHLLARSQQIDPHEWSRNLARLCHTCKTIKPYRTSHCRACNRCVLAYDHHCPYVQTCIGYKNRPHFFLFVLSTATLQIVSARLIYICFSKSWDQYIYYPACFIVILFGLMVMILTISAASSAITNYTGNEAAKTDKYDYLKDSNGKSRNIFAKGFWYNIKYYFHLVEPSYLETPEYVRHNDFTV